MTSIRHFPATHPLPDWRNFGVMLRVLLGVNGLALLAALVQAGDIGKWLGSYLQMAAVVEPVLLVELGLLSLARNALWRLPLRLGQACVVGLAGVLAAESSAQMISHASEIIRVESVGRITVQKSVGPLAVGGSDDQVRSRAVGLNVEVHAAG